MRADYKSVQSVDNSGSPTRQRRWLCATISSYPITLDAERISRLPSSTFHYVYGHFVDLKSQDHKISRLPIGNDVASERTIDLIQKSTSYNKTNTTAPIVNVHRARV